MIVRRLCKNVMLAFGTVLMFSCLVTAQQAGKNYAVLIGGLGGEPQYSEKFHKLLLDSQKALIEQFHFPPENVIVLAEKQPENEVFVDGISNAETITATFSDLALSVTENDYLYVVLFGHGSYDGNNAKLNIPRRDLADADYGDMIDKINAGRIIFINTSSSSSPFVQHLSGERRIVIVATKSPTQRNITSFPDFLIESFNDPSADVNKDGNLSVMEVFLYTAESTERFYTGRGNLATEHAMMDDNGDGRASRFNELDINREGALAEITYLKRQITVLAGSEMAQDSTLLKLLAEKEKIELEIAQLKNQKYQYDEDIYYTMFEELMVELARIANLLEPYQKIRNN
ncbi:hypothetical protein ACFL6L_00940 [candidate division KSB1 bacterium]